MPSTTHATLSRRLIPLLLTVLSTKLACAGVAFSLYASDLWAAQTDALAEATAAPINPVPIHPMPRLPVAHFTDRIRAPWKDAYPSTPLLKKAITLRGIGHLFHDAQRGTPLDDSHLEAIADGLAQAKHPTEMVPGTTQNVFFNDAALIFFHRYREALQRWLIENENGGFHAAALPGFFETMTPFFIALHYQDSPRLIEEGIHNLFLELIRRHVIKAQDPTPEAQKARVIFIVQHLSPALTDTSDDTLADDIGVLSLLYTQTNGNTLMAEQWLRKLLPFLQPHLTLDVKAQAITALGTYCQAWQKVQGTRPIDWSPIDQATAELGLGTDRAAYAVDHVPTLARHLRTAKRMLMEGHVLTA